MSSNVILFLLLSGLLSCRADNENGLISKQCDIIDSLLREQSRFQSNTGIAVALVRDGKMIYNKGFGYGNIETNDTVTPQTMFHLGSTPKAFVAVALMQLVEQHKVDLDAPVTEYIPELRFEDLRYKKITIRHLATHSSGIFTNRWHDYDRPKSSDDALDRYVRSLDYKVLRFDPGERFAYSDANYDIIGDIIYRVTGVTFEDYMKKNILEPSGMHQSTFFLPDTNRVARPYIDGFRECRITRGLLYPVNREHAPSGTLFSNTSEMCNWMITNLNRGKTGHSRILEETTYDTLWHPAFETNWGSVFYEKMCFGWFTGTYCGKRLYLHSGTDHGYRSVFCLIPADKTGVVILSNYRETPIHLLLDKILACIYDTTVTEPANGVFSRDEFPALTGNYSDSNGNVAQIYKNGDLLYAAFENQTCCLSGIREGYTLAGELGTGSGMPFYYDQANVFLRKMTEKNGEIRYKLRIGKTVFEKVQ